MIDYDHDFTPPAPLARITLERPGSDAKVERLPMLVDSGADRTLLPGKPCVELGIEPTGDVVEVEGYDGNRRFLHVVRAVVVLHKYRFTGDYLMDAERDVGIVGRDILNYLILELNGPKFVGSVRSS